ncbi:unnamed protein product [Rotaria socialis]|uniref:Uncharacterized protein n=1 Tax=Rotaria socialis TaxID=392032 RepID=A0A818NDB9_9BILA|nr:unnamed protein product [Rotaria socialis]CAF4897190.1 unnamed protein product [Rotaria socialis]
MVDCNAVGTPQNIGYGALIAANVCMGKINNIKNVALNKVACGVKLIKDSIKKVRKNRKVNKLKNLNNNQLAEVLQNRTPGGSVTDTSGAAPTGQQLRKSKQVSFNNSKSEVLFKEGWKTNELANRSVIKGIKIDFDKESLNDDFIILDNQVEIADVDSKIEIMHDTNLELNKICKINNKFENIVFNATMANKNNEIYPIEIISLDWDNNIKINVSSAEELLRVDCNFACVKDTAHSGDSADSRELPTSELQAVAALPKVLPTNRISQNRTLNLYNKVNNNEFYNVSCFNLLKNQYNYIIDEEYDCFSEVMTSFLQPPFGIFRLLFSCIFAILNNFSINKSKVLNKANIAPVELNNCKYIVNSNKPVLETEYVYNVNGNRENAKNIYTVYIPNSCSWREALEYRTAVDFKSFNELMLDYELRLENYSVHNVNILKGLTNINYLYNDSIYFNYINSIYNNIYDIEYFNDNMAVLTQQCTLVA